MYVLPSTGGFLKLQVLPPPPPPNLGFPRVDCDSQAIIQNMAYNLNRDLEAIKMVPQSRRLAMQA